MATKYFTIDKDTQVVRILSEEDLRAEFEKDYSVQHTDKSFEIWKTVNASTEYSFWPKYKPFNTEPIHNERYSREAMAQMLDAVEKTTEYFLSDDSTDDEIIDEIANDAHWEVCFYSPLTGMSKFCIGWNPEAVDTMENMLQEVIANC